jgi:hypothetical protein
MVSIGHSWLLSVVRQDGTVTTMGSEAQAEEAPLVCTP